MDKEELKKSTCINLRCVTQSAKGGVPLNQLQNDYRQLLGTPIPFKDLGYSSLENFLSDIPDVICLKKNADGSLIAEGVADASTAHIAKLISKQKSSKKSKYVSAKPAVVIRTWGSSGKTNFHPKKKVPLRDFNNFPPSPFYKKPEQNSKHLNLSPAQQELKKSVLINLRSVVQSCKDGVPLNRLQKDYWKFIGANIPFERLGYSTLYEFLRSIPDVINLKTDANEQFIATGVIDQATAHLFGTSVKPKPSKPVSPSAEHSENKKPTLLTTSTQKAESTSFFKLPQNAMELSDINSVLKHAPAKKKVRKKTQPVYSVSELIAKNQMKHASKEELIKAEPVKAAKPVVSCKESSLSEVSLSKTDFTLLQNQNEIAKTIQNQIQVAGLSSLVWMHFILYGPSNIESLRKKVLLFYGYPFSVDSEKWKEKVSLLSQLPIEALHQCLYLLRIDYDLKASRKSLQDKLINFLALYAKESGANAQKIELEENKKELYASSLTLSSVSSDVLSKCSFNADNETSDATLSDRNFVSSKTKFKIDSDYESDLRESPLYRQNQPRKPSYHLEEAKKTIPVKIPNAQGNLLHVEKCKTNHFKSTNSASLKPSATKKITSTVHKLKSLNEKSLQQKTDTEDGSKTKTSCIAISKRAKKNRRKKKKKSENAQKDI